jgi:hypothetical protein
LAAASFRHSLRRDHVGASYNRIEPRLAGIPFFHWYQLAWILIGAAIVLIVYLIETRAAKRTGKPDDGLDGTGAPGDIL